MDQINLVTPVTKIKNHIAGLERLADHIHDKLHNAPHSRAGATGTVGASLFQYLACHVKRGISRDQNTVPGKAAPQVTAAC